MRHLYLITLLVLSSSFFLLHSIGGTPVVYSAHLPLNDFFEINDPQIPLIGNEALLAVLAKEEEESVNETVFESAVERGNGTKKSEASDFLVPFYSQFNDISTPSWRKIGCGIASTAMLIDYYSDEQISVDDLLAKGIKAGAYLDNAGWIHSGLISLASAYGLAGSSKDISSLGEDKAFAVLEEVLEEGPVIASVHYTFDPKNTIPHLVVINGVKDGLVYYNDPAENKGGGTLTIEQFKRGWKERYIVLRPKIS